MYEAFYGLRERPFDLGSNLKFLYMPDSHREALDTLKYGIKSRKGVTVLTGEAGTGKTTMIRAAMAAPEAGSVTCVHLMNPRLTRAEFFEFLVRGFELPISPMASKTECLAALETRFMEVHRRGDHAALIVDEAQSVSDELVEEIRLLTNMQVGHLPFVSIVMAGQPEFADRLDSPLFRHLKQRVALRCTLSPLTLPETAGFIATRIRVAEGSPKMLFTREAVEMIHTVSGGIPRVISVVCDNALVAGLAANERPVGRARVEEVCRDFRFEYESRPQRSARPAMSAESVDPVQKQTLAGAAPLPDERQESAEGEPSGRLLTAYEPRKRFGFWRSR